MTAPSAGGMPPEEFRAWGHRFVDWAADYLAEAEGLPVLSRVAPGEVRARLPASPPTTGESFDVLFKDFESTIVPGITHWNHPSFFGYFAISGSGPGILGELLTATLNVNAMVWKSSPAATELEELTLDWLRQFVGLPEVFQGTINDTASTSTFHALVAARHRCLPEARERGMAFAPPGRIYATTEAHSSVGKAVLALGLGTDGIRPVEQDRQRRMDPSALDAAIAEDVTRGVRPVAVVGTIGTTSTAAVDPIGPIADVAERHGAWLHVDAAYGGPAAAIPEAAGQFAGWERADSIVVNPHKWLFTPIDCSVLYARDPATLRRAFSLTPAYLETGEAGVTHLMDHGLALGRRFRALKLWFVMRYFGVQGLKARIRQHMDLAQWLASAVDHADGWERWQPTNFSLVVIRNVRAGEDAASRNARNMAIMDRVNAGGRAFLSHTEIEGEIWLRFAVGNVRTEASHVAAAWDALRDAGERG